MQYCDTCQLPLNQCDEQNCAGAIEREYFARLAEWEASEFFVEGPIY